MTCIASPAHDSIWEKSFISLSIKWPWSRWASVLPSTDAWVAENFQTHDANLKLMLHLFTFSMSGSHKIENQLQNIILFQVLRCQLKWIMPLLLLSTHGAHVRNCKFKRQQGWTSSNRAQRRRLNHVSLLGALLEIGGHITRKWACIVFSLQLQFESWCNKVIGVRVN